MNFLFLRKAVLIVILCINCSCCASGRKSDNAYFEFPGKIQESAIYTFNFDENSTKFISAAMLADKFKLRGKLALVGREPDMVEFSLLELAFNAKGDEMTTDEVGQLFFLKSSEGIFAGQRNLPKFTQTGRFFGYRIIYGPDPAVAKIKGGNVSQFNYSETLESSIPAALVVEEVIGLGEGFVAVQNSKYYKLNN